MTESREGTREPIEPTPSSATVSPPSGTDPLAPSRAPSKRRPSTLWRSILLLSCLPALSVGAFLITGAWQPGIAIADAALRVTLSLLTLFCAWAAIVAVFTGLLRASRARILGEGPIPRLLAALLTFAVFPEAPRAAVVGLVWAASQVGLVLPIQLAGSGPSSAVPALAEEVLAGAVVPTNAARLADAPRMGGIDGAAVTQIVLDYLEAGRKALAHFGEQLIERIPIAEITAALATWAVLTLVLRALADWNALARITRFVQARPHFNWPNAGFLVLLGGGLFLSLAAITSLPRLSETHRPNSEVSAEAMERLLLNLQTPREQIDRYLPEDLKADPLGAPPAASALLATPAAAVAAPSPPAPSLSAASAGVHAEALAQQGEQSPSPAPSREGGEGMTDDDRRRLERHRSELAEDLAKDWASMRDAWHNVAKNGSALGAAITSVEKQDLAIAVGSYRVQNLDRRGSREEAAHFLAIQSWYAANVDHHRSKLEACANKIRQARLELGNWGSRARQLGAEAGKSPASELDAWLLRGRMNERLADPALKLEVLFYDTQRECSIPRSSPSPERPALGSSLGPLHFIAGWLLDVGSLPLALIIGMMGFGLLGSVISTFVRERAQAMDSAEPIFISDLTGVVLRGLSAAIVVFLAVQGGLAVLSGAGSDPNPYVLLLVCFVAAVFSENVWLSAHAYFLEKLASITRERDAVTHARAQTGSHGAPDPVRADAGKPADSDVAPVEPAPVPGE